MQELGAYNRTDALARYSRDEALFPLIGAVLQNAQLGRVFANHATSPSRFFVEHAFGFSQVFGIPDQGFDRALQRYLLQDRDFHPEKIRLYTPSKPEFLDNPDLAPLRSRRQRFYLDTKPTAAQETNRSLPADVRIMRVTASQFERIECAFGIARRFWPTELAFIEQAHGMVAWIDGQPAAICYAAAIANNQAEIDVLTAPEYRRLGLGKLVVEHFIAACRVSGVTPVWDCFANNAASIALSRSCGFAPHGAPYDFFTIPRNSGARLS